MRARWASLLLGLALLLAPALYAAQELPGALRAQAGNWRLQGQGEMRWFGFAIYSAELWLSGPRFDMSQPFALQLTYARDLSGDRLVTTSIDEIERLGTRDPALLASWRVQLARVFPDVKSGETITGVYMPGRGASFYHEGKLRGEIVDQNLARSFFEIWFDPRTRAPELRQRLLGDSR